MKTNPTRRHRSNEQRPDIFVARTIDKRDKKFPLFLHQLARGLGRGALIKDSTSVHLTFLDNYGLASQFESHRYTPQDVASFGCKLEAEIRRRIPDRETSVLVNQDKPIGVYGKLRNVIGLEIVRTAQLLDQRNVVTEFLASELGCRPALRKFDPHIAIGTAFGATLNHFRQNPETILPSGVVIPERVALNGLDVYLGAVHATNRTLVAA